MLPDHARVEQHPRRHEEQAEQHVAERLDVLLHLMAERRLGNEHPGDERAERERQPEAVGDERGAERDEQQVQHEQLLRAAPRDDVEPARHEALADDEQQRERDHDLDRREAEREREILRRLGAERGDHDQQRHHREILEQQHAEDVAAVLGLDLEPLGEHLRHDRRRRHRERAAERDTALPRDVHPALEQRAEHEREHEGRDDLQEAESEHEPLHRPQLREREFEADRKHQEHHAEFREVLGPFEIRRDAEGVRADQDADGQIAEHRRQVQRAEYDDAHHRGQQQQQGHFERGNHRRSVLVRRGHGNAGAGGGGGQATSDESEGAARRTNAFAILRA